MSGWYCTPEGRCAGKRDNGSPCETNLQCASAHLRSVQAAFVAGRNVYRRLVTHRYGYCATK
jgi:hypothetical protein